jgi:CspA family cold shock protein
MIKGTVKFFNNAKGFGFITPDDGGKDVFVPAATITQSGTPRLKAGQRISFETEPDPKGPKAVRLTLLDEPPREMPREASREIPREMARDTARDAVTLKEGAREFAGALSKPGHAPRPAITLYHDAESDDAGEIADALRDAGHDPRLVDVIVTPPTRDELKRLSLLLREADQSLVRRYDPLFLELQLDDRFISESEFWQGIAEHPQLINGPVVAMGNKARLARGPADVKSFLGQDAPPSAKPKGLSPRMTAMMNGIPVPPPLPKEEKPKEAKKAETPAPEPVLKAEVKKSTAPVKKVAAPKVVANPVKKPAAKAVAKPVKKAAPIKKAAKKK